MRGQGAKPRPKKPLRPGVHFVPSRHNQCGIGIASQMMLDSMKRVLGPGLFSDDPHSRFATSYVHGNMEIPTNATHARRRIGFFTWETTVAQRKLAEMTRGYTEIWTPSRFSKDALISAGVELPVFVVPHITDLGTRIERTGKPRILVQADGWSRRSRKRPEVALAAAMIGSIGLNADIVLKVHHMTDDEINAVIADARDLTGSLDTPIEVVSTWGSEFIPFLRTFHILVSATRGEAFGLPLLEAMANGVAVCAHNKGGQGEFLHGYIAETDQVPAIDSGDSYFKCGDWWDVKIPSLASSVTRALVDFNDGNDVVVVDAHKKASRFTAQNLDEKMKKLLML